MSTKKKSEKYSDMVSDVIKTLKKLSDLYDTCFAEVNVSDKSRNDFSHDIEFASYDLFLKAARNYRRVSKERRVLKDTVEVLADFIYESWIEKSVRDIFFE